MQMPIEISRRESFIKALLYRAYASLAAALAAWVIFDATFETSTTFFLVDICLGLFTFYTFDRVYIGQK